MKCRRTCKYYIVTRVVHNIFTGILNVYRWWNISIPTRRCLWFYIQTTTTILFLSMEITTPPSSSQHYVLNTKEAVSKGPNSILRHNIANEMISFQKIDSQFCHGLASKQSLSTAFNYK